MSRLGREWFSVWFRCFMRRSERHTGHAKAGHACQGDGCVLIAAEHDTKCEMFLSKPSIVVKLPMTTDNKLCFCSNSQRKTIMGDAKILLVFSIAREERVAPSFWWKASI